MKLGNLAQVESLFRAKGDRQYSGEPVTQLEHALQTAYLAEKAGSTDELIAACLLHDVGHMSNDLGESPTLRGLDDQHQFHGVAVLKNLFPDAVLMPIRLHVDAKRYLCATQTGYRDSLSADSKRSLELQGGAFSPEAAARFNAQPHAFDAVKLRRWDDVAKSPHSDTPDLQHFLSLAARCAK